MLSIVQLVPFGLLDAAVGKDHKCNFGCTMVAVAMMRKRKMEHYFLVWRIRIAVVVGRQAMTKFDRSWNSLEQIPSNQSFPGSLLERSKTNLEPSNSSPMDSKLGSVR